MLDYAYIKDNVISVQSGVKAAVERSNRLLDDVRIVAVTKSVGPEVLPALLEVNVVDVAENRWQIARDKLAHPSSTAFRWHFIGSLQLNKVKYIAPRFDWVHSADREELCVALSHEATRVGRTLQVLLQVNVAEEPQKHGFQVDHVASAANRLMGLPGIALRGLMTMAPAMTSDEDAKRVRGVFRVLRQLQTDLKQRLSLETFDQLSMGMSSDYPLAIEEGATMVRIGRDLVGERMSKEGES